MLRKLDHLSEDYEEVSRKNVVDSEKLEVAYAQLCDTVMEDSKAKKEIDRLKGMLSKTADENAKDNEFLRECIESYQEKQKEDDAIILALRQKLDDKAIPSSELSHDGDGDSMTTLLQALSPPSLSSLSSSPSSPYSFAAASIIQTKPRRATTTTRRSGLARVLGITSKHKKAWCLTDDNEDEGGLIIIRSKATHTMMACGRIKERESKSSYLDRETQSAFYLSIYTTI